MQNYLPPSAAQPESFKFSNNRPNDPLIKDPFCTASFYGDGFVQLKTAGSSSKNSLHVRFRTSCADGLLFLAAGETDYLWVVLQAGLIQAQIDLGSGERTLLSEKTTLLNDLTWHSIELQHHDHNVTLTVDRSSKSSLMMPSPDVELSGWELYVGGLENSDKLYLFSDISYVGFRGCLDEVLFNEYNLLSSFRSYSGYKTVHEVSLGCSSQFSASVNDSISFFSSKAYVSLPTWEVPQEGEFECEFYSSAENGLLLYSSAGKGDYVALEIRHKHLVAFVRVDGSKTVVSSIAIVSEENWHSVRLYVTPWALQLNFDYEILNTSFPVKSRAVQMNGPLFLGGVNTKTIAEVHRNGLLFSLSKYDSGGSFKGCLRNIRVNGQDMGLPNALVTKDVSIGCEPVTHVNHIPMANPNNFQPESPQFDKTQTFVLLKDLEVPEGGRAPIGSKHIRLNLEFHKLGIQQSQVMFRIEEQPVHGQLILDVYSDQKENTFSVLDLYQGRVMYVHGGSEDPQDYFMFSVFTTSINKGVHGYLKGNHLYRFNIIVTPINDAPELSLPEGNHFILLENSKRCLSVDMLRATDPDSNYTELVFSLLGDQFADFLELADNPGKPVTSFSHMDLEQGKVTFVHKGIKNSSIAIRVSDEKK
ncbi:Chondroitin sulfate proteoglycan 4 [Bagarius yarrelli]|uniref:Chondroitin sulfate proteoglycan 4 n=1 Tax=Bagarius yarrelli TaxID=175774 RepID=A0A556V9T2_BAGYA|nr:Chondroitin sulfate proteoglycan 4 [Bagarius yarrelli]